MALTPRGRKEKGAKFERELAEYLSNKLSLNIKRTPLSGSVSMHKGIGGSDLTGTPHLWVEAKRTETVRVHEAMAQAVRGTTAHGSVDMPCVITRRSKQSMDDSLVIMRLSDFTEIYRRWLHSIGYRIPPSATDGQDPPDPSQPTLPF